MKDDGGIIVGLVALGVIGFVGLGMCMILVGVGGLKHGRVVTKKELLDELDELEQENLLFKFETSFSDCGHPTYETHSCGICRTCSGNRLDCKHCVCQSFACSHCKVCNTCRKCSMCIVCSINQIRLYNSTDDKGRNICIPCLIQEEDDYYADQTYDH